MLDVDAVGTLTLREMLTIAKDSQEGQQLRDDKLKSLVSPIFDESKIVLNYYLFAQNR